MPPMTGYVDRLVGAGGRLLDVDREAEREFEARLAECSGLAFRLAFSGAGVVGGSIADGDYNVLLDHAKVHRVDDPTLSMAADYADHFFRLFGDINGDGGVASGAVNNADYNQFKLAFGSPGAGVYNAAFDYTGDGFVNNRDYNQFKLRFASLWTNL